MDGLRKDSITTFASAWKGTSVSARSQDSREQLQTFGERLMPILADIGIELSSEPEILEVHNIVKRT